MFAQISERDGRTGLSGAAEREPWGSRASRRLRKRTGKADDIRWSVMRWSCASFLDPDQIDTGEQMVDLLQLAAGWETAEVDHREARVPEQGR